jgi:phage-related protein (TIGR01555 family)
MIDGDEAEFQQHTASFGSVPELVREFLQVLSGGCDIPATRFLGISPGGIGETGRSEHEDYYNSIDALQRLQIKPKMLKFFNIIGTCRFGLTDWLIKKEKFDIVYPPCWNLSEKEQAELNKTTVDYFLSLYDQRLMTEEQVIEELKQRNIFLTKFEFEQRLKDLQVEDLRLGGDEKGLDDLRKETGGDGITASHV